VVLTIGATNKKAMIVIKMVLNAKRSALKEFFKFVGLPYNRKA
jgi:hypothetical protein